MNKEDITADDLYMLDLLKRICQRIETAEASYTRDMYAWIEEGKKRGVTCGGTLKCAASMPETEAVKNATQAALAAMDGKPWRKPEHYPPSHPEVMTAMELELFRAYGRDEPLIVAKLKAQVKT